MTGPVSEADAPFADLFSRLLQLLRERPARESEVQRVAQLLATRVERQEALIEAGIENSWALDGDPLKERLQTRQVDAIRIAPGAGALELLALGRALADDTAPVPSTAMVRVKLLPDPLPLAFSGPRESLANLMDAPARPRSWTLPPPLALDAPPPGRRTRRWAGPGPGDARPRARARARSRARAGVRGVRCGVGAG